MLTAYSTQPRLEPNNKPIPRFATLDDLIAAMKADAKQIKKRAEIPTVKPEKNSVTNEQVAGVIEANPGATASAIANELGANVRDVHNRLKTLEKWRCVKIRMRPGVTKNVKTYHRTKRPVTQPDYSKCVSDGTKSEVLDFIKANPGCSTRDISEHVGKDRHKVSRVITKARHNGDPIRSEPRGWNLPHAHYWEGE